MCLLDSFSNLSSCKVGDFQTNVIAVFVKYTKRVGVNVFLCASARGDPSDLLELWPYVLGFVLSFLLVTITTCSLE